MAGTMMFPSTRIVAQTSKTTSHAKSTKKATAKKKPGVAHKTASKRAPKKATAKKSTAKKPASRTAKGSTSRRSATRRRVTAHKKHHVAPRPTSESIKLTSAFKASEQLRPMAQQLAATRSPAAYRGVESYAKSHPGEGAAAAYLALGHAYMLDRKYDDAVNAYRQAARSGKALDDYADYHGAQAALQAGHNADAYALLDGFAQRHPASIFISNVPVLLANAYLQQTNPQAALKVLLPLTGTPQASHVGFRYALGRAYQMSGDTAHAA
ncbi:MAG: lytic transglycosylase, partial [Edaphobacter sp.]